MTDPAGTGGLLQDPPDLILQLEDALRQQSRSERNSSTDPDAFRGFLLPEILNSTLHRANASHLAADIPMRGSRELAAIYVAYSVIFLVSLLANSLVCYVIAKNKRFRSVTYAFIANLSASDLAITIFNIPFNLIRYTLNDWIFGQLLCKFTNLTLMCAIYVSTFTMAAVAMDRYMVILYPLRPRLTFAAGIWIVAVTWLLGAAMSLPFPLFARVQTIELALDSANCCRLVYPDPEQLYDRYMTLATFIAQFVIPISLAAVAYGQIVQKLWSRKLVGHATYRQKFNHEKTRRRTIKMLIVVVLVFVLCWLPLNLYHILTDFHPDPERYIYNSATFLACHWLAMSSCCYNPFIYCWFNGHFRHVLRSLFARDNKKRHLAGIRPGGGGVGKSRDDARTTRTSRYRILERMRIGSALSSGTRSTCRSSSRRDRNPRRIDRGSGKRAGDQPVLNTI
ncbi:hypothetical protein LSH36_29g09000 [Paralvinella palmiformis]|uniref:G-protein coupled receptors family 1 profile domain-containing protein n=1 Tax=Paralvinella palmiformis TaxID=53620 RepID=A0AAD9K9W4_9ANNE|nr:hypothetical protein LSH36_29g09000 [Paralvinella palmiformis]